MMNKRTCCRSPKFRCQNSTTPPSAHDGDKHANCAQNKKNMRRRHDECAAVAAVVVAAAVVAAVAVAAMISSVCGSDHIQ